VAYQEEKKDVDQGPVVQGEKQTAQSHSGFASVFGSKAIGGFGSLAATATGGNGTNGLAFGKPSTVVEAEDASNTEQRAVFGTSGKSENAQDKGDNEIETGEEGEENVFSCNATLFVFESKQWKERGKGLIKINLSRDKKGARVIMRQQGNLKLLLNANLWDKMKISKMEGTTVRQLHIACPISYFKVNSFSALLVGNYFCLLQSFIRCIIK
jgi:Ran-binding protein 3